MCVCVFSLLGDFAILPCSLLLYRASHDVLAKERFRRGKNTLLPPHSCGDGIRDVYHYSRTLARLSRPPYHACKPKLPPSATEITTRGLFFCFGVRMPDLHTWQLFKGVCAFKPNRGGESSDKMSQEFSR